MRGHDRQRRHQGQQHPQQGRPQRHAQEQGHRIRRADPEDLWQLQRRQREQGPGPRHPRNGNGWYEVRFKRSIGNCVVLSSIASIDSVNPTSAPIGTGILNTDTVFVLIRNDFADTRLDADFSVAAFC
jgi:hypothetical protein